MQTKSSQKWIQTPDNLKLDRPFFLARPLRPTSNDSMQYQINYENKIYQVQIKNSSTFLSSNNKLYDDMCDMDILNQPQILNNLVQRYQQNKIFTNIGSTLIIINPYRFLPQYFSNQIMTKIRDKIITRTISTQKPHIFLIAGQAFLSMIDQKKKQAIVISGQSGAGKTQSTKYCMQILTSLSHKQNLSKTQQKILACNPLLQAFGNSKTVRNNNSSRFGKYVQIYFFSDNTIAGASINSYLLEKSRVVATSENQRTFHIFYALIASQLLQLKPPNSYNYLSRSKCYTATGIDDKKHFTQIQTSMKNIGFTPSQQTKIWNLLAIILQLGNIQFDDTAHQQHQSNPCTIKDNKQVDKIITTLSIPTPKDLQKILLFQKKKFLKQITLTPYSKTKCLANINTLSKAIYNSIFQFILSKVQKSLKPLKNTLNNISINILDIFGFQNFDQNSFQQFCINFTNQKLLKLYNKYIFQREMEILQQDGLLEQATSIKPPTNDSIIQMISGKLSLFSIINDSTTTQQFKDSDIIQGFQTKLTKYNTIKFDKFHKTDFTILHSQCNVRYNIDGFKQKNQDKVLPQISQIVNNLFQHESREQSGKTILTKFSSQIDDLISQLTSSNVHFIRCIKPNEKKVAGFIQQKYIINQIRYLGIFQTIQIRKKTFPSRWLYQQFLQRFQLLFIKQSGTIKQKTQNIIKKLNHNNQGQYLLGNKRIYMNLQLENLLSTQFHLFIKKKYQNVSKICKYYQAYKYKLSIKKHLKLFIFRLNIVKKYQQKQHQKIYNIKLLSFNKIKQKYLSKIKLEKKIKQDQKLKQSQKIVKQKKSDQQKKSIIALSNLKFISIQKLIFNRLKSFSQLNGINQNSFKKNPSNTQSPKPSSKQQKPQTTSTTQRKSSSSQQPSQSFISILPPSKNGQTYKRTPSPSKQSKKSMQFNQSFLTQKTFINSNNSDSIFQGYITVPPFNPTTAPNFQKLLDILSQKYQHQYNYTGHQQQFFSPPSIDGSPSLQTQDLNKQVLNNLKSFNSKQFFKKVLRKRTNFLGMKKDEDDILVCKQKPLSTSLTMINQQDDKISIKIFKHLLKIIDEANIQNVFKLIQIFIQQCQNTSPQVKNQIVLQLLRQSNSDNQMASVRIVQSMTVFIHVYNPDKDFLYASLYFFLKKLTKFKYTQKQNQYFRYIFKKIIHKIQKPYYMNYVPIKYQLMALMCKRKISIPVYLSIGTCIMISVQSFQTFQSVKPKVMYQLGIDNKRLNPQLFAFFQIISMDATQLQQNPIIQSGCVWDTVTYWQKAKQRYIQKNLNPPQFHLMLKIRYMYQCHNNDLQTISLMFAQANFEYLIGRVVLNNIQQVSFLASVIKKLKQDKQSSHYDYNGCYPSWALKIYSENDLKMSMIANLQLIQQQKIQIFQLKFMFIKLASKCRSCLSYIIPAQNDIKICFRPNVMIITNRKIKGITQIPIKTIKTFENDAQKFYFSTKDSPEKKSINTQFASLCTNYLQLLQILVKNSKNSNNRILTNQ